MAKKHMKGYATQLNIKEMKIKTTVRYQLTLVRMAIIKKSTNKKHWRRYREKNPSYSIGGNVNWCSYYGKQYGGYHTDPAISLLSKYPEKMKTII